MKILKFCMLLSLPTAMACGGNTPKEVLTVRVDNEFTSLYMPDSCGVTSADGTISILLDDGSSLFMTGDCFVGNVVDGKRKPGEKMINNSLVHIGSDYRYLGSHYVGTPADPSSLCTPPEAATSSCAYWYWPGHGFQHGDILYCFMTKFYQGGEGQWGFVFDGTDIVQIDLKDYSVKSTEEIYDGKCPIHWGHCVMKADSYYYIYGTRYGTRTGAEYDPAQLYVSRTKFDETSGIWELTNISTVGVGAAIRRLRPPAEASTFPFRNSSPFSNTTTRTYCSHNAAHSRRGIYIPLFRIHPQARGATNGCFTSPRNKMPTRIFSLTTPWRIRSLSTRNRNC